MNSGDGYIGKFDYNHLVFALQDHKKEYHIGLRKRNCSTSKWFTATKLYVGGAPLEFTDNPSGPLGIQRTKLYPVSQLRIFWNTLLKGNWEEILTSSIIK